MSLIINLSPEEVQYEGSQTGSAPALDVCPELYQKNKQPTVEIQDSKYIFQLHLNGVQVGYCYSINYGLDVIRSLIAEKLEADCNYQLEVSEDCLTVKFSQVQDGYIFGKKYVLLEEFKLSKLPKLEVIRPEFLESESEDSVEDSVEEVVEESEDESSELGAPEPEPEPEQVKEMIGEEVTIEQTPSPPSLPEEDSSSNDESSEDAGSNFEDSDTCSYSSSESESESESESSSDSDESDLDSDSESSSDSDDSESSSESNSESESESSELEVIHA